MSPAAPTAAVRRPYLWRTCAAVAAVGMSGRAAGTGLPRWERSVFRRIHALPDVLEPALWAPMQLGNGWAPVVAGAASWRLLHQWRPSVGATAMGLAGWSIAKRVKRVVQRGRPASLISGVAPRWGTPSDGLGFLSGHTTVAFCLATVLSPYLGRAPRYAGFGLAGIVGVARLHVGAHLPLDVVGGAALGTALGSMWHAALPPTGAAVRRLR